MILGSSRQIASSEHNAMQLEQFVQDALTQIFSGIRKSQDATRSLGGEICPVISKTSLKSDQAPPLSDKGLPIEYFHFDIAVNVAKVEDSNGDFSISVGAVSIGGKGKKQNNNESSSRISFRVPVSLPHR